MHESPTTTNVASGMRDKAATIVVATGAVAATAVVHVINPHEPGNFPTCPSLALFGFHCPGCGSTRCVHSLTHGDFATAWSMNPLTIFALAYLVWAFAGWCGRVWFKLPDRRRARPKLIWAILAVVVIFGIARNTPWGAFLAPG